MAAAGIERLKTSMAEEGIAIYQSRVHHSPSPHEGEWCMTKGVSLADIPSFGGTDADEDSLLLDAFEDHQAFLSLRDHSRFCVLGRKGSGKTAIFKKLLSYKSWDTFAFGHTFSDYPWHFHEKQKSIGVPVEQCYVQSWRYLCFITLAKVLLNQDNTQPYSDAAADHLSRIERFILDSYGTRDPDVTQIFTPSKTLKFSGDVGASWKIIKANVKVESVKIEDLPIVVQEVNHNMREATVESLNPELNYFILFDQLDLGFSLDQKDYAERLTGLLLAAREINIYARNRGKRLTIGLFLRDDIYDHLQFEDKNKITENFCTNVVWDHANSPNTLKSLMEKRFKLVFGDKNKQWEDIFDETRDMSGRQRKYNYILDRTFLRPRDMIKFCNECLQALRADPYKPERFENQHVISAQANYSDYLLRELDDEIHKHVPKYKNYLEVIKDIDSLGFEMADYKQKWEARKTLFTINDDPAESLRNLFEFSVIGCLAVGGGGGGAQYIWRYKDTRSQFNEAAASYRVHYGLKEILGLKRFSKSD